MSKAAYEKKPTTRLKRHLKNIDPEYTKKRKEYSDLPGVKERRKALNKRRRILSSNLINLAKTGHLTYKESATDTNGYQLQVNRGRLCSPNSEVLFADKAGSLCYVKYDNLNDLESSKFDNEFITPESQREFEILLKSYEEFARDKNGEIYDKKLLKEFLSLNEPGSGNGDTGDNRQEYSSESER